MSLSARSGTDWYESIGKIGDRLVWISWYGRGPTGLSLSARSGTDWSESIGKIGDQSPWGKPMAHNFPPSGTKASGLTARRGAVDSLRHQGQRLDRWVVGLRCMQPTGGQQINRTSWPYFLATGRERASSEKAGAVPASQIASSGPGSSGRQAPLVLPARRRGRSCACTADRIGRI
jgi:hypothetical protein